MSSLRIHVEASKVVIKGESVKTDRKQNVNFWTGMQQGLGEKDVYSASFVGT